MRLLHIADLHLGKKIHEFDLIEDQRHLLTEIVHLCDQEKVDGVMIAGDVFDKAIPSLEALGIWEEFLENLAALHKKIYLISGNHDSGYRLTFAAKFFEKNRFYFKGKYEGEIPYIEEESIRIYLFPFIRPNDVRIYYPEEEINNYQDAVDVALKHTPVDPAYFNILICHQFVSGAKRSDSEEISIGTLDQIHPDSFRDFAYVALGHLHRPQAVQRESIRYSGSLCCYSESEIAGDKSVVLLDIQDGGFHYSLLPLHPLHRVKRLEESYATLSSLAFIQTVDTADYFYVNLSDKHPIPDALAKLRRIYPRILQLRYISEGLQQEINVSPIEEKTPMEMISGFYFQQNQKELSTYQTQIIQDILEREGKE